MLTNSVLKTLAAGLGLTIACAGSARAEECTPQKLVGTWRIVSVIADGTPEKLDPNITRLVLMTPTHSVSVDYDRAGTVMGSHGGPYTVSGSSIHFFYEFRGGGEHSQVPLRTELVNACDLDGDRMSTKFDYRPMKGPLVEFVAERVKPSTPSISPTKK
jgi:hypothetical protein